MEKTYCPHCGQHGIPRADFHLIRFALERGCRITVDSGGYDTDLELSTDFAEIREAVDAVDECELIIYYTSGEWCAWARIVHGNEPNEEVSDYSANEWVGKWWQAYKLAIGDTD